MISGTIRGVKAESFINLVMLKTPHAETFHLVQFEGSDNFDSWQNVIVILINFYCSQKARVISCNSFW